MALLYSLLNKNCYIFSLDIIRFNWEKFESGATWTHVFRNPGKHINLLDHWVHSFLVSALDTQELTTDPCASQISI